MRPALVVIASALAPLVIASCASPDAGEHLGVTSQNLDAYCNADVSGETIATETDYLPHVVTCENGGAPTEALKAQAVAARTYLYYDMNESGSVSSGAQTYSCSTQPGAAQTQAVTDTSGLVLQYKNKTIAAFYVAGGVANPPACIGDSNASTESDVTYNEGKSGSGITQSPIGEVSPSNDANRGCMSQNGSACLANAGKSYVDILKFYYGEDIEIVQATGTCVTPASVPDGGSSPPANADGGTSSTTSDGGKTSSPTTPTTTPDGSSNDSGGCAIGRDGSRDRDGWMFPLGVIAAFVIARTKRVRSRRV